MRDLELFEVDDKVGQVLLRITTMIGGKELEATARRSLWSCPGTAVTTAVAVVFRAQAGGEGARAWTDGACYCARTTLFPVTLENLLGFGT